MGALEEARKWYASLQKMAERPYWVDDAVKRMREHLGKAGVDAAALDPEGKKSAAEMEQELEAARRDALLKGIRKEFAAFVHSDRPLDILSLDSELKEFRKTLDILGLDMTALAEGGKRTEMDIQQTLDAAISRRCLAAAREKFHDYENATAAGLGTMTDYLEQKIAEHLKAAGAKPEDLDPEGRSTQANIEGRMKTARQRLHLMAAREELKSFETTISCVYADEPDKQEKDIRQHLAVAEQDLPALDESGNSTAADIEKRLQNARWRMQVRAAREVYRYLQKLEEDDSGIYTFEYSLGKLRKYLAVAGADASVLDETHLRTAPEMEDRLTKLEQRLHFYAAKKALADFEMAGAPQKLDDIYARAESISGKFNKAGDHIEAVNPDDPDAREKITERLEAAMERARGLYYDAGGKMPVMKTLRLVTKTPG